MVNLTIDGKAVSVPKGTLLVEAAKTVGIEIPVFCYHPKLDPAGVCRMCQVEVEGQRKPQTACTTTVAENMIVHTDNAKVADLRRSALEYTLINHPLDCPVCDKGGECDLQDLTFAYGPPLSRYAEPKEHKPKAVDLGNFIVLDEERCILCRRCARFDEEIAQENVLIVADRGHENVITTANGVRYNSYFSGNTIELCPVGALTSELYRFKARPWDLSKVEGICTGCSVGCNTRYDYRHHNLLRVISRDNPAVDGGWLCDRGRFNYQYVDSDDRLRKPLLRGEDGKLITTTWTNALTTAGQRLKAIIEQHGPSAVGIIGGGRLSLEEAYLLQKLGRVVLGTGNVDHRIGSQSVASSATLAGRISDLAAADAILIIDSLPAETAPVLDLRIRRSLRGRKAKLAAIGAALPSYRQRHVRVGVQPGQSAAVVESLAAGKPGAAAQPVLELLQGASRVAIVWDGADPAVGAAIHKLAAGLGKPVTLHIPGAQSGSRGAEAMGLHPAFLPGFKSVRIDRERQAAEQLWRAKLPTSGLGTTEMVQAAAEGKLKALYLVSANLLDTYPDRALVEQALATAELVIVQDVVPTETVQRAHIVFAASAFAEKSGSFANLDGLVQPSKAARRAEGETQPDLLIIDAVAASLGGTLWRSQKELEAELRQLGLEIKPGTLLAGAPESALSAPAAPSARATAGGLAVVPVDRLYAGGGTARFDRGFQHVQPAPEAGLHPTDAKRLGFSEGDGVRLGELDLIVRLDRKVVPGTVQVIKGLATAPAGSLAGGAAVTLQRRSLEVAD